MNSLATTSSPAEVVVRGPRPLERGSIAGNILLVDDDQDLAETIMDSLRPRGFRFTWRSSAEEALVTLDDEEFDVLVTDISLGGMSGLALCERVATSRPNVPVVLVTAFGSMDTAISAVRAGAHDFVTKPFEANVLALALERAIRHRHLRDEVKRLRDVVGKTTQMEGMIGTSPAVRRVFEIIDRVSDTDSPVLITGKSGTGKELVARALHQRGRRSAGPFVPVHCASIPDSMLELGFFGHIKDDLRPAREGLLVKANRGTILLDEVAEMPLDVQSKLLRALEEKVVRPVGSLQDEPFDARVITASNRDLESEVEQKRFREDLFYRINVIRLDLPPLRARGHDVLLLAQHFLERAAAQLGRRVTGLSSAAAEKLLAYAWPGNVRELENSMERAVTFARTEVLSVDDLPEKIRAYESTDLTIPGVDPGEILTMEEVERRHILTVVNAFAGSKSAAAAALGIHPSTLYRKLDHYGIKGH